MPPDASELGKIERPTASEILRHVLEEDCAEISEEIKAGLVGLTSQGAARASQIKDLIKRATNE